MSDKPQTERRRQERHSLDADIEFIVDTDIVRASAVDISDHGMAFDLDTGLPILLQIRMDGDVFRRQGTLVRVSKAGEKVRMAIEFSDTDQGQ